MKARAHVVAGAGPGGRTRLESLRSQAPLALRETIDGLTLVGTAGGPLGGDELDLHVEVGPGARLRVGGAAATVAQPGPGGAISLLRTTVRVAGGGLLQSLPEPTVVCARACHRVEATLELEVGATLRWREEAVLGRSGEPPGTLTTLLDLRCDGRPLLVQESCWGAGAPAGWDGPAVLGRARAAGFLLCVGPPFQEDLAPELPPATAAPAGDGAVVVAALRLAGPGVLVQVLAPDGLTPRRHLDAAASFLDTEPETETGPAFAARQTTTTGAAELERHDG